MPEGPTGGFGTMASAGAAPLNEYAGKTIRVAFKYQGNGAESRSTTYQIDNVKVQTLTRGAATRSANASTKVLGGVNELAAIYKFNGSAWLPYENAIAVGASDYEAMGLTTFTSSHKPENYLPQFLTLNFPYAQEGQTEGVIYTFSDEQESAEYIFTAGVWVKNENRIIQTDQFVLSNGKWNFDPSTVLTLTPSKTDALTVAYFQAATDWVWENIDQEILGVTEKGKGYVTSYGNNEYYTGCSAYYGNVDMRPAKAREQYAAGYEGMSDEEVTAQMEKNFIEVMSHILAQMNPNAVPVDGVDVLYTLKVGVYTTVNLTKCTHQLIYKVVGPAQFEYIEDSYQPIQ